MPPFLSGDKMKPIGLYLHIPFCKGKCPYCDFYSTTPKDDVMDLYTHTLCGKIKTENRLYDTVYFGGGTPSLLGAERISKILVCINKTENCEVTLECNPSDAGAENSDFNFSTVKNAGVNRISLGLQSAVESERKALGRKSGCAEIERAIKRANEAGISNISLDLMLGIPNQTKESLKESIDFCSASGATHISAYILKIEEGTFFYKTKDKLTLPDEDETCDLYLYAVEELEKAGFKQYEISNFSKNGFESKHNLKYWHCEEYLGIGAAAHSFVDSKRFYYERSIESFINGAPPVDDGKGGSEEEYIMLTLRLCEGLNFKKYNSKFGKEIPQSFIKRAKELEAHKLTKVTEDSVSLTTEGFLVSNSVISSLIDTVEN